MSDKLSKYFSLQEMTASKTAVRIGDANQPDEHALQSLTMLCVHVLDPIREAVGRAVGVSSGYRSQEVNKAVGGAAESQHCLGEAADIYCMGMTVADLAKLIAESDIPFDQCIQEPNWVHVSYGPRMRREVLTKTATGYVEGLPSA